MEGRDRNDPNENDRSKEKKKGRKWLTRSKKGSKRRESPPRQPEDPDIITMTRRVVNREESIEPAAPSVEQDEGLVNRRLEVAVLRLADVRSQGNPRPTNAAEETEKRKLEEDDEFRKKFQ